MRVRILVMSDTHGNFQAAMNACSMTRQFDAVIHLGDGNEDAELLEHVLGTTVIQVAGNCDIGSTAPREYVWECEGKRLLLVHGDAYRVKSGLEKIERRAVEAAADAVLFGHTHIAMIETRAGILFVNPGTLIHPSHHTSVALLEITRTSISAELYRIE